MTGDGSITLSISSIASGLDDESAKDGDSLPAFKLDATDAQGDSVAGGSDVPV